MQRQAYIALYQLQVRALLGAHCKAGLTHRVPQHASADDEASEAMSQVAVTASIARKSPALQMRSAASNKPDQDTSQVGRPAQECAKDLFALQSSSSRMATEDEEWVPAAQQRRKRAA